MLDTGSIWVVGSGLACVLCGSEVCETHTLMIQTYWRILTEHEYVICHFVISVIDAMGATINYFYF